MNFVGPKESEQLNCIYQRKIDTPIKEILLTNDSCALAFLGDSVFALYVKDLIVSCVKGKADTMHQLANKILNANAQAKVFDAIKGNLNDEEQDIARRARNTYVNNVPKSSDLANYKKATSLEAIIGHWHQSGQIDKIKNVVDLAVVGVI